MSEQAVISPEEIARHIQASSPGWTVWYGIYTHEFQATHPEVGRLVIAYSDTAMRQLIADWENWFRAGRAM
jgi:hypothetical protein